MGLATRASSSLLAFLLAHFHKNEANENPHVSFARHELWSLQKDGNLCPCRLYPPPKALTSIQRAKPATKREMTQFHSDEYIEFLSRITPSNMNSFVKEQHKCL